MTPAENPSPIDKAFKLSGFTTKAIPPPIAVAKPAKNVNKNAVPIFSIISLTSVSLSYHKH